MENKSLEVLHDKNEDEMRNEVIDRSCPKNDEKNVSDPVSTPGRKDTQVNMADSLGAKYAPHDAAHGVMDSSGEVNMEASITPDDVIRAGGFGARDDIGSFLPVASDSTDFEASIRDARGYEEPQGEICRPGLGWKGAMKTE